MSAHEALSPDQFVTMHRGVGDWGGQRWDKSQYHTAEELFSDMAEDRPGFGQWWDPDEQVARFYGTTKDSGVVISADFHPRQGNQARHESGTVMPLGTHGRVRQVSVVDDDGTHRVLPHTPGLRVQV